MTDQLMWWAVVSVNAKYRWLMTASPMCNRADDLKALLGILYRKEWREDAEDEYDIPANYD